MSAAVTTTAAVVPPVRHRSSLASAGFVADGNGTKRMFTGQIARLDGKDRLPEREGGTRWLPDRLEQYPRQKL